MSNTENQNPTPETVPTAEAMYTPPADLITLLGKMVCGFPT